MAEEYDKDRVAALIKEARDMMAHLRDETEKIKSEMESVLDGPDEDQSNESASERALLDASILAEVVPRKSFWRRWH